MLEYLALGLLLVMTTFIIYLVIYIHDIPYEIAKKRDHPHQDAIHIAGWVSLFLLHTIWPLLWIWAYLYQPGEKFLQMEVTGAGSEEQQKRIEQLENAGPGHFNSSERVRRLRRQKTWPGRMKMVEVLDHHLLHADVLSGLQGNEGSVK